MRANEPAHLIPYTIAVAHQKGGVGKTTTALTVGACLAEQHVHTLLIDLDPSLNLTNGVGLSSKFVNETLAEVLLAEAPLGSAIRSTTFENLDILPSGPGMLSLSHQLHARPTYEMLLDRLIAQPRMSMYEVILIDCPPMLDALTVLALSATDLVIIPTQCEYYALQALESMFRMIRMIRAKNNPKLRYRLLVTMFDRRGKFHARVLQLLREQYSNALLKATIGFDTRVRESQMAGVPLTVFAPKCRAAEHYRSLSRELQFYIQKKRMEPASAGG
ncbi:MAG: ParA family protein [Anaerolineaceae bacterium]|nr:ParA family protein [Anaerolineaceae bacterium]